MPKPQIYLYLRHYVHDEETLERYRDIVFRIVKTSELTDFSITAIVGFDTEISGDLRYQMFLLSRTLLDRNIAVHHMPAKGVGHAFLYFLGKAVSDISPVPGVICLVDADQFIFDEVHFHHQINKLASTLVKEGRLVGLGIRERISLGEGELNEYRQIDEMFHAVFVKRRVSYKDRSDLDIPKAYNEIGDPLTGCYLFNISHPKMPKLISASMNASQKTNLWKFAGDPFMILLASKFGRIITEIVPTRDNPPGKFTLADIRKKNSEIGKTSLRNEYAKCVKSPNTVKRLQKYYDKDAVIKVQKMVLKGLLG